LTERRLGPRSAETKQLPPQTMAAAAILWKVELVTS
jgi:hypothetical protein